MGVPDGGLFTGYQPLLLSTSQDGVTLSVSWNNKLRRFVCLMRRSRGSYHIVATWEQLQLCDGVQDTLN